METQLWVITIIIMVALIMVVALLLMKAIIYNNEIKLSHVENESKAIQFSKEEAEMKLEKSKTDYENTKLLMEYAQFMKSNGQEIPAGYQSKVDETFKEIEKQK